MSTTENSVTLTMAYRGTNFQRKYQLNDVNADEFDQIKARVLYYNANLPEADRKIFISDDYDASDPDNVIGELASITAASYKTVEYERINLN